MLMEYLKNVNLVIQFTCVKLDHIKAEHLPYSDTDQSKFAFAPYSIPLLIQVYRVMKPNPLQILTLILLLSIYYFPVPMMQCLCM